MSLREQVFDRIRAAMARLDLAPPDLGPEARLVDDLDLDSLDWADLRLQLEEDFDVVLDDEKLASVRTVQDVVDRVVAALAGDEDPCTPS